jgi:hypothetical protein
MTYTKIVSPSCCSTTCIAFFAVPQFGQTKGSGVNLSASKDEMVISSVIVSPFGFVMYCVTSGGKSHHFFRPTTLVDQEYELSEERCESGR